MKKLTAFFTIVLLVSIAIFFAFASNQNRDTSRSRLVYAQPDDNLPFTVKSESNSGVDSEDTLYSVGYSYFSYFRNGDGDLRCSAGASAYVSCSSTNANYITTYTLYAKVPGTLDIPNVRNPQTLPKKGFFSDSVYRSGEGNGAHYTRGGASGSASASGTDPSSGAQHNTSAASPTPETARDLIEE